MAIATFNPSIAAISGKSGGIVFRMRPDGRAVLAQHYEADSPAEPTDAQAAQRLRFAKGIHYAREVLADPLQRRLYEAIAKERGRRTDKLLTSDYLTPPTVDEIDLIEYKRQPGGVVRVLASDDIEVVEVTVEIATASGEPIEKGTATKVHGVWCYPVTRGVAVETRLVVTARAEDRPGNVTAMSISA